VEEYETPRYLTKSKAWKAQPLPKSKGGEPRGSFIAKD